MPHKVQGTNQSARVTVYNATVAYHKHPPTQADCAPPCLQSTAAPRSWLQADRNRGDAEMHILNCGQCKTTYTYKKQDAHAALLFHYGEYCIDPSPLVTAPHPTVAEALSATLAKQWRREMKHDRDTASNTVDNLAQITACSQDSSTSPTKRPHPHQDDDGPPQSPAKRQQPEQGSNSPPPRQPSPTREMDHDGDNANTAHAPTLDGAEVRAPETQSTQNTRNTPKGRPPPITVDGDWGEDHFARHERYSQGLTKPVRYRTNGQGGLAILTQTYDDYETVLGRIKLDNVQHTTKPRRDEQNERYVARRLPVGISVQPTSNTKQIP